IRQRAVGHRVDLVDAYFAEPRECRLLVRPADSAAFAGEIDDVRLLPIYGEVVRRAGGAERKLPRAARAQILQAGGGEHDQANRRQGPELRTHALNKPRRSSWKKIWQPRQ